MDQIEPVKQSFHISFRDGAHKKAELPDLLLPFLVFCLSPGESPLTSKRSSLLLVRQARKSVPPCAYGARSVGEGAQLGPPPPGMRTCF